MTLNPDNDERSVSENANDSNREEESDDVSEESVTLDSLLEKIQILETKNKRQKSSFETRFRNLKDELESEVEGWKSETSRLERELEGVNYSFDLRKKEVAQLNKTLKETNAFKNAEIARLKREAKEDMDKYTEEIKELRTLKKKVVNELEESKSEVKELTRKLSEANLSVVGLNYNVKTLEQQNKALNSSVDKLSSQLDDQIKVKSERDIEVERLKLSQEEVKARKAMASSFAREETEEKTRRSG